MREKTLKKETAKLKVPPARPNKERSLGAKTASRDAHTIEIAAPSHRELNVACVVLSLSFAPRPCETRDLVAATIPPIGIEAKPDIVLLMDCGKAVKNISHKEIGFNGHLFGV